MSEKREENSKKLEVKKEKRNPINASKIFATIIVAFIAIALIGTSIWVIIPAIQNRKAANDSSFGSYNGENITLEQNSILYQQYTSLAQQNPEAASSGDINTQYSLWASAYTNAVVLTAVQQMAEESNVRAPQQLIDDAILDSGYYNDENGEFSQAIYNETTNDVKASLQAAYKRQVPLTTIINDISSVATSKAEQQFIGELATKTRSFEYIPVTYEAIPNEVAVSYLEADPSLFVNAGLSTITTTTEESINKAYEDLKAGKEWDDVVAQYSEDSYAEQKGDIGTAYGFSLKTSGYTDEQVAQIFSHNEGDVTEPISLGTVFRIFKLNTAVNQPNSEDEATINAVKFYMADNETETVAQYIEDKANEIAQLAKEDFDEAAIAYNTVSVAATPGNIGSSMFMGSFSNTDSTYGMLLTAASDPEVMKTLYTAEEGYISDPIKANNYYIIVKVVSTQPDLGQSQIVDLIYGYYSSQILQNDFANDILLSDAHKDNFGTQFVNLYFTSSGSQVQ